MNILEFKENYFICSNKKGLSKFLYKDLYVVKCDRPFVCFHLKDRKIMVQKTLSDIRLYLKGCFIQVNRTTVVNMEHVKSIIYEQAACWVLMDDGIKYKVSQRREKTVRNAYCLYV